MWLDVALFLLCRGPNVVTVIVTLIVQRSSCCCDLKVVVAVSGHHPFIPIRNIKRPHAVKVQQPESVPTVARKGDGKRGCCHHCERNLGNDWLTCTDGKDMG